MSATPRTPVVLIIRDGWGRNPNPEHRQFDAVSLARTPVDDELVGRWPTTLVRTCGEAVGLPPGTMGNSEVGHQNIGAGRVVDQEIQRINKAIADGSFKRKPGFLEAFEHARRHDGSVHLLGLVSDGKVHSDLSHLEKLIDLAVKHVAADRLFVHVITDGRDTAPTGGLIYVARVEQRLAAAGGGRIASVIGRYYAMDRDHRWDRVAAAYACLTGNDVPEALVTPRTGDNAREILERHYAATPATGMSGDEFLPPTQVCPPDGDAANGRIRSGDAVIFFNFRGDRPREITRSFVLPDAAWQRVEGGGFRRGRPLEDLYFATLTTYEQGLPVRVVFERAPNMVNILGGVLADHGIRQFRCAETEKFAHVTFFLNDYREEPFDGESRCLIPSPRDVRTYDQRPEMSAAGVTEAVIGRLRDAAGEPVIIVNFANPDMVGHTGNLAATIRAVEATDAGTGHILETLATRGGRAIVTADHGNAEQMWDPVEEIPHTAHTTYDVPLIVCGEGLDGQRLRTGGGLSDVAPTLLDLLGLEPPPEMTGRSLLTRKAAGSAT
ncbi:MAG: 2,3-bisphosphoglycerate-independent phosphoglycerate mutase [Phycisphaerales bacterium]|nr:2,3-bisphosphoglycerate-independent phosphoglycerate mutase [Phycisphaerales bacterium]NNM27339.1 2,3-bisphosphoglycerate-independent phosphoglycerate mutase [Phycisphaerales bacterium]